MSGNDLIIVQLELCFHARQIGVVWKRQHPVVAGEGRVAAVRAGEPVQLPRHGVHRLLLRGRSPPNP